MKRTSLSTLSAIALLSLTVALLVGSPRSFPAQAGPSQAALVQPAPPRPAPLVSSASAAVLARLSPDLASKARSGSREMLTLSLLVEPNVDLSGVAERWQLVAVPVGAARMAIAKVRANKLLKLASVPGVIALQPTGQSPSPTGDQRERQKAKFRPNRQPKPQLWAAQDFLGVRRAAVNGYDGTGVTVGVLETGIDFANPDLQGTFATDPISTSAYYGLPLVFDSSSAFDYVLNEGPSSFGGFPFFGLQYADSSFSFSAAGVAPGEVGTVAIAVPASSGNFLLEGLDPTFITKTITFRNTSKSGTFHYGIHPDGNLLRFELIDGQLYSVPALFIVSDEQTSGTYDAVFVDLGVQDQETGALNATYDFTLDPPARLGLGKDPTVAKDLNADGLADLSGGLVYFIADGAHHPPVISWLFAPEFAPLPAGNMVAFYGDFNGDSHGTGVAAQIVGQGVIKSRFGNGVNTPPLPSVTDGDKIVGGVNQGFAPGAKIFAAREYELPFSWLAFALGYDGVPDTGDEAQVINNSWGYFGYSPTFEYFSSVGTLINTQYNDQMLIVASAGNGGQGYGSAGGFAEGGTILSVGANTQYGSDDLTAIISDVVQLTSGDPSSFTSRGPDFRGRPGVAVSAVGSSSSGAAPLNLTTDPDGYYDGNYAWVQFGGTSQAGPQTAAVAALVYQAYKERTGAFPDWQTARELIQFGASDVDQDAAIQGAGQLNAEQSTAIAGGLFGAQIDSADGLPASQWQVGDYDGQVYLDFPNVAARGASYTRTFTVSNPSALLPVTLDLASDQLTAVGTQVFTINTTLAEQDAYDFRRPDYLITPDQLSLPTDADLMQVELVQQFEKFCTADPQELTGVCGARGENAWYLRAYAWTDWNANNSFWADNNANGVVNAGELELPTTPTYTTTADLRTSLELNVISDAIISGNAQDLRIHDPAARGSDGLALALVHRVQNASIPTDTLRLKVTYYKHQAWPLLSLSPSTLSLAPGASATFTATASVPTSAAYGFHQGAIRVTSRIPDTSNEVGVRVLHAIPESGPVDILINGQPIDALSGLEFGAYSGDSYTTLPAGVNTIEVVPSARAVALQESSTIVSQRLDLPAGGEYTLVALIGADGKPALQVLTDGMLDENGLAKLRVGHFSPDSGPVDVYANDIRVLANLPYRALSPVLSISPDNYTLTLNPAGSATPILTLTATIAAGDSVLVSAVGLLEQRSLGLAVATPIDERSHFPVNIGTIPVVANVAATADLSVPLVLGDSPASEGLFDIGTMKGKTDWRGNGQEDQGDWQNYFVNITATAAANSQFIARTTWSDYPTDIDLVSFTPRSSATTGGDFLKLPRDPAIFGPYDLARTARSVSTFDFNDLTYDFETASGSTSELLVGPLVPGLNLFAHHNMLYGGELLNGVPYSTTVGTAIISPTALSIIQTSQSGASTVNFASSLDLGPLSAMAYGLSAAQVISDSVGQASPPDNIDDPNGNDYYTLTVSNSGLIDLQLVPNGSFSSYDLDLILQRKVDNGYVTVGSSAGSTASESISVKFPTNGEYRVIVLGYNVPEGASYTLTIKNLQGDDLLATLSLSQATNLSATTVTIRLSYTASFIGTREGIVYFGPAEAPTAFSVPVTITSGRVFVNLPIMQLP